MHSIGVDIGGSHISASMYEHSNKLLLRHSKVSLPVNNKGTVKEIIGVWGAAISRAISAANLPYRGVGIAIPGPFDYDNGVSLIQGVDKYESLYKVDVRKGLALYLDIHPTHIRFINDATSFALAEASVGKASSYSRMVAITLGTGFGSSFCIEGRTVDKGPGVPQGGFLFDKYHGVQQADDLFSTRGIINHYRNISGKEVNTVLELCQKIPSDTDALKTFKWFGRELGVFLSLHLKRFGAEVLVFGGNIAKAFEFFEDDLRFQMPPIPIYISDYGEEAAIMGAALQFSDS